ncbi:MAG: hypothetical protein M1835_006151 [Candelina submexicana]|nr:MAG: hypothetical protein M1835_006151 [Candelina submexicana]
MSSHVVVIDSTARRAVIKTTPAKYLVDVLQEACTKLGLDASQYGLKNNNKQIELSNPMRLSGLSSGAKLELVLLSRSPSVVSVGLQLPEGERLVDKFPSTITLWLVLRKFESGDDGGGSATRNFTARGTPLTNHGETNGQGRLYYETPVLRIMEREFSSFTDLQKSLGQLGLSRNVLIRLSFRTTETPLEEAMQEIDQYFKSIDGDKGGAGAHSGSVANTASVPETEENSGIAEVNNSPRTPPEPQLEAVTSLSPHPSTLPALSGTSEDNRKADNEPLVPEETEGEDDTIVGPGQRIMSVFAPPSDTTPHAARQGYRDTDYEPTIEHARIHQSRLSEYSRNKRLPSEAEIKAQEKAASEKFASVNETEIKIRYPDQTTVVSNFTALDTATTLYEFVGGLLESEGQPFLLTYTTPKGLWATVPRDGSKAKLIRDLGFSGKMLVNFKWDENASPEAKQKVLKDTFKDQAKEIKVPEPQTAEEASNEGVIDQGKGKNKEQTTGGGKEGRKGGMPKWLKGLGKK